jgi:propanediol utilization protein
MFIRGRKNGKMQMMRVINDIIERYRNEETTIVVEVSNKHFTMSDMSIIVSRFKEYLQQDGKELDYGFTMKDDKIKMKLIVEEKMAV